MPTSDLDMPLLPSAEQIRRREFATVRRGYDPQQVRAYLTSIANQVGTLERELSQLRLEVGFGGREERARWPSRSTPPRRTRAAASADDPYDALSKRFATLIEMADQEAERILENARSESSPSARRGEERGRPHQGRRAGARGGGPAGGDGSAGASQDGIGSAA